MTINEILESLKPWNRNRSPRGLLSAAVWRDPGEGVGAVPQPADPDWVARPDLFPSPGIRNGVFDPSVDHPATAQSLPFRSGSGSPVRMQPYSASKDFGTNADDNELPDSVVNSFRESLDGEGLRFLRQGPRTSAEQLAFAQRIDPDAHRHAAPASDMEQIRSRQRGSLDRARHFVGPDGGLYQRSEATAEPLAYRLRRGMEDAVGGHDRSDVRKILAAEASDDDSGVRPPLATDAGTDAMRERTAREIHRKENRWPSLVREPDRRKSILENTAGLFDIADNPDADWSAPWYSMHADGYNGVKRHDSRIEREAKRIGVDPDLVRAIMYVEHANGYSYGGPAQLVGAAGSLYPMNIRPKIWQGLLGKNADFNDSDVNVRAGVLLLKRIADRVSDSSIAKIATLYNSLARDEVSDYGAQVARAYRDKSWTSPTLP